MLGHHTAAGRILEAGLLLIGVVGLVLMVVFQLQLVPDSPQQLPAPVAFRGVAGVTAVHLPAPAPLTASAQPVPPPAQPRAPSPATVRAARQIVGGVAQRLVIDSIGLDTAVVAGGIRLAADGSPEWETVPNIAVHYAALTALVGAPGNAVIAGHVSTRAEGNVFIDLYKVELGDEVQVWDEHGVLRAFTIASVRLVPPTDTSVMDPTPEPTLTLMTCGGSFDPVRREFSDRLVVTALPLGAT